MPAFLTAARIKTALERLAESRAKTALFDFLIIKRTLTLKGENAVYIRETDETFVQALDELGACGTYKGVQVKPDSAFYLNPFFTREKSKHGYRLKRYRSNGTNTNIRGGYWPNVVVLANDKASLRDEYQKHLATLLLNKGKGKDDTRPHLREVAIWYFRAEDVEPIVAGKQTSDEKVAALIGSRPIHSAQPEVPEGGSRRPFGRAPHRALRLIRSLQ